MEEITDEHIRALLRERVEEVGSQALMADELGVSRQHLNRVMKGSRRIPDYAGEYVGYKRCVVWRKNGQP